VYIHGVKVESRSLLARLKSSTGIALAKQMRDDLVGLIVGLRYVIEIKTQASFSDCHTILRAVDLSNELA
jgi:hypothetical protein